MTFFSVDFSEPSIFCNLKKFKYFFPEIPKHDFLEMKMDRVAEEDSVQSTPAETKVFLNEYEGLTHLYRLLHARQLADPTFLNRNINYNRRKIKKVKS